MMDPVLFALLTFMILGSIVALETKDLLSAVIAAGVVGLALSIVFLLLGAPDIAITQVVVEVLIVTVLIRVSGSTGRTEPAGAPPGRPAIILGTLAIIAVAGFMIAGFLLLPEFGAPGARPSDFYLVAAPGRTGAANVVTAIILDFRAYDTLGEATVILASIVAALAVLRRPSRIRARRAGTPPAEMPAPVAPAEVEPATVEVGHA
jgi:multisubunit Na+/H+ antiporter MnhB subunit